MRRSALPAFSRLLIAFLGAWALFNLFQTVKYILADYSPIPITDYWRIPQLWANGHALRWTSLWQQHNESRIIFPELIEAADMLLLHGRMYLPIAVSGLCCLGIGFVLAWAAYSGNSMPSPAREAALLLAAVVITWKGSSTVIATPFQLAFTLLQVSSMLALLFLSKLAETRRGIYLAAVISAAVVCTYSAASGLLLWIILLAAAILLKIIPRQILILTAAGVTFSGLYFFHYRFLPGMINTSIPFLCSYFSMPFGGFGFTAGAANVICMSACAVIAGRRGFLLSRLGIVVFGAYLFIFLGALLTTEAAPVTLPTASWALLAIALVWTAATLSSPAGSMAVALSLSAGFFFGFHRAAGWVDATRLDLANAQITAIMLKNGLFDPSQVKTVCSNPETIRVLSRQLQQFHKSIFARGNDKWIGANLLSLPLLHKPVPGKITRVYPIPGGLEILGWADTDSLSDDHDILFVDGQNRIAGFGGRPAAGLPASLAAWDTPQALAFVGYVSLARPIGKLSAYVRTVHGQFVQPIAGQIQLPVLPPPALTAPQNSATLPEQSAAVASIPARFLNPPDHCLVLPVLHGPDIYGQSVQVLDAGSGVVIAQIPFLPGRSTWERWRIPIPESTPSFSIVATEEGNARHQPTKDQWTITAPPERCSTKTDR